MPAPKKIDPYESPLAFFGHAVRRHRLRLGMTQTQLGKRINYSEDAVSKIETAEAMTTVEFGEACDEVFGTHEDMTYLAKMARKAAAFPVWLRPWVDAEREAHTLRSWQPLVVPGLLQTPDYARELLKLHPGLTDAQIEEQTTARLERQQILDRDDPPLLWVVLHENVLRTEVGSPEVMRDQLAALIEASGRKRVTSQVLPQSAGMHAGNAGAFAVASFDDQPDVVYLESARKGLVTDRQEDVQALMNIWEAVREETLPASTSLDLISKVMEQWT